MCVFSASLCQHFFPVKAFIFEIRMLLFPQFCFGGALSNQLVECRSLDRQVTGSNLTRGVLEQDTSSSLLSTGST